MELILQTAPTLNGKINQFGCNFRSLQGIAEVFTQKSLTSKDILDAYDALQGKAIDEDCTVGVLPGQQYAHPEMVINDAFKRLGNLKHHGYQIGGIGKDLKSNFWAQGDFTQVTFTILVGRTPHGNEHFRLGDHRGKLIFDPYGALPILEEKIILFYTVKEA